MKKYISVLIFAVALIAACNTQNPDSAKTKADKSTEAYLGTYEGIMPCADCEGIDTELSLNPDGTFTLIEYYLDTDGQLFLTEGTWRMSNDLGYIALDSNQDEVLNLYYTLNRNKDLNKLDINAKPIESALNYTLRRK